MTRTTKASPSAKQRPVSILKLDQNGTPVYVKIMSPIEIAMESSERMVVTNLESGEEQYIIVNTKLGNSLRSGYSDDGYVGRCFLIKKFKPQYGKNYAEFEVSEINWDEDIPVPVSSIQFIDGVSERRRLDRYRSEYLNSSLWRNEIRPRVLERDRNICRRCGGKATEVHHRSYATEVMEGNDDDQLVSVCPGCHNVIDIDDDGNKRSMLERDRVLLKKYEDNGLPKIDLRKKLGNHPDGWKRMSAVQQVAWTNEDHRLRYIRNLRRGVGPKGEQLLRKLLYDLGMDDASINGAVAEGLGKRVSPKKRKFERPPTPPSKSAEMMRNRMRAPSPDKG